MGLGLRQALPFCFPLIQKDLFKAHLSNFMNYFCYNSVIIDLLCVISSFPDFKIKAIRVAVI